METRESRVSRVLFKKKQISQVNKLMQNFEQLESKIFETLLKQVSDHLLVFFQFARLYF